MKKDMAFEGTKTGVSPWTREHSEVNPETITLD